MLLPLRAFLLLSLLLALGGSRPPHPAGAVRWLTPQALADSMRVRPRPVLVNIYTPSCRYCKLQDLTTFRDKDVVSRLNARFYAVALNAESREPIRLGGHTFTFQATGPDNGVHGLALALARDEHGQVVYPTVVLLDEKLEVRGRWPGLIKAGQLRAALNKLAPGPAAAP
ncbi:hypothetical protein SAMN00120144_0499 [Hymenobacter roseosalivarius DSM 11622]|uniref:Thioredoxin-like fold domain-containing protein n=1 Tax=Hymenobacter roseosalivarius DSM 11622 TaxID=645990 RepID=A0A1W1VRB9_9BACT|nr:thioredoxin family protein [Hymenobacter roseosalivarius]SMB95915.1 hypothetical protein SAMN00120144_0499 [Hymenobacter roseosalivarius DSM 11622]